MITGKMKIAWMAPYTLGILIPDLHVNRVIGGGHACSWIVNLSNALVKQGDVELHIITECPRITHDQSFEKFGIHFHVVKSSLPIVNRGMPSWLPLDVLTDFFFRQKRLLRMVHQIAPDIVHAHGTEAAYGIAGLNSGYPCVISIQGIISEIEKYEPCLRYKLMRPMEQRQVRQCEYFTCRTHWDSGFVRGLNPKAKIFHIEEAMNPVFFEGEWEGNGQASVLFVGSLQARKGIAVLIKAMGQVVKSFPDAKLTVVGTGTLEYQTYLRGLCKELNIIDNVDFTGHLSASNRKTDPG